MAQYQPKIDSREFEVANPDRYPSAWGGDPAADATEIAIRLWGVDRLDRSVPLSWNTDSILVYMVADLVGASGGRVADSALPVMAANFEGSRQALVAAKRIQTSLLEFMACRDGDRVGAAILIYHPRSSDLAGFSSELVQLALRRAKAGQILLADHVSQRLRDVPGIEFRAAAALTGDHQTGLAELLWTTPERLAQLADSVVDEAPPPSVPPQSSDIPSVGATLIVHSPIANSSGVHSPIARSPITRREPSPAVAPPVMGGSDFVVKESPRTASQRTSQRTGQIPNIMQDRTPVFEPPQESPDHSLTDGLDEFGERPFLTRTRVILGVVALVLVAAVIAVLFRPTQVSKRPLPLEPSVGTDSARTQPRASEPDVRTTDSEPPVVKTEVKPEDTPPVVIPPPQKPPRKTADNRVKTKKDKDVVEEPPPPSEIGGISQKDIPGLLRMALSDAGAGNYEKAKTEYKKVLLLQPGNQEAKDGMRRLDLIPTNQR
jgi:hypothetical protein